MSAPNPEFNHEFRNGHCSKCGRSVGEDVLRPTTCTGTTQEGTATTATPVREKFSSRGPEVVVPPANRPIGHHREKAAAELKRLLKSVPLTIGIDGPVIGTFTPEADGNGNIVGTAVLRDCGHLNPRPERLEFIPAGRLIPARVVRLYGPYFAAKYDPMGNPVEPHPAAPQWSVMVTDVGIADTVIYRYTAADPSVALYAAMNAHPTAKPGRGAKSVAGEFVATSSRRAHVEPPHAADLGGEA